MRAYFSHQMEDEVTPGRGQTSLWPGAGPGIVLLLNIKGMIRSNHTHPFNYREKVSHILFHLHLSASIIKFACFRFHNLRLPDPEFSKQ